jgi:DNA polymerase III epsilon subunit-like protein
MSIRTSLLALASVLSIATAARAASEADYKAALATAEAANKQAADVRNQWTTTAATINAAKKFAESGDFDKAVASAVEAEALAKASIFQATSEKKLWKDMEIR